MVIIQEPASGPCGKGVTDHGSRYPACVERTLLIMGAGIRHAWKGALLIMEKGIKNRIEITVTDDKTAKAMGSGELPVFATPAMAALIEETCWRSVADELENGQGTVGTRLDIEHLSATPVGLRVACESELTDVDGRKLTFSVNVYDEKGPVGRGTHERFVIDSERFLRKAEAKAD